MESLLIFVLVLVLIGFVAWWIITKFFPGEIQQILLLIVGVLLLIALAHKVF